MKTVLDALNAALHTALAEDPKVYILGEDVLDPYGGAFKVTRGLSDAFPERVITTPISEPGFVGLATGMALRGLRPVVEIMFGDFTTLIADQLINGMSKYGWMYGGDLDVPIVIRTPMGGGRGYGPTHSQTLEKHFLGVPGLKVLAPTAFADPTALLRAAIADPGPVLFIEHKAQYQRRLDEPRFSDLACVTHRHDNLASSVSVTLAGTPPPEITIVAYGHMADLAAHAMLQLAYEREIFSELVVVEQLDPLGSAGGLPEALIGSIAQTRRLLTVEEGSYTHGWGAEVLARVAERCGGLRAAARVASADTPVPAAPALERHALPSVGAIVDAALSLTGADHDR